VCARPAMQARLPQVLHPQVAQAERGALSRRRACKACNVTVHKEGPFSQDVTSCLARTGPCFRFSSLRRCLALPALFILYTTDRPFSFCFPTQSYTAHRLLAFYRPPAVRCASSRLSRTASASRSRKSKAALIRPRSGGTLKASVWTARACEAMSYSVGEASGLQRSPLTHPRSGGTRKDGCMCGDVHAKL
jgi:hypothetical protein